MNILLSTSGYEKERVSAWLELLGGVIKGLRLDLQLQVDDADGDDRLPVIEVVPSVAKGRPILPDNGRARLVLLVSHLPSAPCRVQFSASNKVPFPFTGRCLETKCVPEGHAVPVGYISVASTASGSLWSKADGEGGSRAICSISDPVHILGHPIHSNLSGFCFLNLLPAIDWLRGVGLADARHRPVPRATFMFDDPNLHGMRYGYVNYEELAASAEKHNYHVSFATCPIDAAYYSDSAADLFRSKRSILSLLVHGNNHTRRELADRTMPPAHQFSLMQQGMNRIRQFEIRSGVSVDKVMAPPHGVCSDQMIEAMDRAGFEAVCVSHGSLAAGSPSGDWSACLGLQPVNTAFGHYQIPRFPLCADSTGFILLATYFDQAIILVGHHWDLRSGLALLETNARIINSLGTVKWGRVSDLNRFSYSSWISGTIMECMVFADSIQLSIPQGVTTLRIRHALADRKFDRIGRGGESTIDRPDQPSGAGLGVAIPVQGGIDLSIEFTREYTYAELLYTEPSTSIRAIARRALVLSRDFLMPLYRPTARSK